MADLPRRTHAFFQLFLFLLLLLQLPCNGSAQLCRDIASSCCCPCNGAGPGPVPESMASKGNDECASMESRRDTAAYPHSTCPLACPCAFQENHVMDLACPCSYYPHSACVPDSMACPTSSFQENDQLGCVEMCRDIACPSCQPCPLTYPQCACEDDNGSPPESSASEGNVEQECMETCRDFAYPCCSQSTYLGDSGFGLIDEPEPCPSCPHSSYNELALEVVTSPSSSKGNWQRRHMGFRESAYPSCSQNPRHAGSTTVQMPAFDNSVSLGQNGEWGLAQVHADHVNASFSVFIFHGAGKHTQKHSSIDSGSSLTERQPVHWEGNGKAAEGRVDHPDNSESKASDSVPTEALGFVTFPSFSKGKEQHRHMEIRNSAYPSCSQSPRRMIISQILAFEQSSVSPQPHREQGLPQVHEDHANASFSVVNVDRAGEHTQVHLSMDSGSSLIENQPVHRERDGEAAEGHVGHHGNAESGADDGVSAENLQQLQRASLQGEALYHQEFFTGERKDKIHLGGWHSQDSPLPAEDYQEGWCPYASDAHLQQNNENVNLISPGEVSPAVKDPAAVVESSQGVFGWVSDKTLLQVSKGDGVAENKHLQDGHRDKVERKAAGVQNLELLEKSRNESKGGDHWEGAGSSFNGDSYNNKEPSQATPHSHVFGVHEEDKGDASNQVTESQMTISAVVVSVGGGRSRKSWEPQWHGEGETQDSAGSGDKRRKSARLKAEDAKSSQVQLPDFLERLTCAVEADPEVQTLNLQLLEITRKLQSGQALNGIPEGARFPSPEHNYDTTGIRINTQEVRARENLARERQEIIARLIKKNPAFRPSADYSRVPKFYKKLYIPVKEYPGYNFIGLVIGPRGNTQKRIERETGAKIVIRGRGLIKEGKILQKRNFKFDSGENEDLHIMVEANDEKSLEAAASMVKKLLAPVGKVVNEHKSAQLWELAVLNSTIRDSGYFLFCGEQGHQQLFRSSRENSFESNLTCQICGDGGNLSIDCPMKGTCRGNKMNDEYLNFLEELGGAGNGPSFHAESGEVCSNTRQDPTLALSAINNPPSSSTAMEYSDSSPTENRPVHQECDGEAAEGNVDNRNNSESGVSDDAPAENLQQYHREQQQLQLLQGTGLQMPLQMLEELMIRYYQVCPTYPHSTNGDRNELALEFATSPSSSEGNKQHRHMEIRDSAYHRCSQSPRHGSSTQSPTFETSTSLQPNREQGMAQVHEGHEYGSCSVVSVDVVGKPVRMHLSMDGGSTFLENRLVHQDCYGQAAEGNAHHQSDVETVPSDGVPAENLQLLQGASLQGEAVNHQEFFTGDGKDEIHPGGWCSQDYPSPGGDYPEQGNQEGWCPYANNSHLQQNDENVSLFSHGEESAAVKDGAMVVKSNQGAFGWISDETLLEALEGDGVRENEQLQDGYKDKVERKATGVWNWELLEKTPDESKGDHWEGAGSSFNGNGFNNMEPSPVTPHPCISGMHVGDKGEASDQMTGSQMIIYTAEVSVSGERRRQSRSDPQSEGEGEMQDSVDLVAKRRISRRVAEEAKPSQIQRVDIFKHWTDGVEVEVDPEVQTLNLQLLEIIRKLQSRQVLNSIPERTRFPLAEPIYNNMGIRIKTGEARARENLARERQEIIAQLIKKNPGFRPPADYSPPKLTKKLYIPAKEYPGYTFIGLVISPRGDNQKRMERETGAKIVIGGKGLIKEGEIFQKRDFKFNSSENEGLHVLVEANDEKSLDAAVSMLQKLLTPVDEVISDYKSVQLRELAALNGTIRDSEYCLFCGEHRHRQLFCPSWENTSKSNVTCQICGDDSHPSIDCPLKGASRGNKMDGEDLNFLAVLRGGGNGPSFNAESGEVGSDTRQGPSLSLSSLSLSSNNPLWSSTAMDIGSSLIENRPVHQEHDGGAAEGHVDHQGNAESGVSDGVLADNLHQYHQEQLLQQGTGLQTHLQTEEELMIRDHQSFPTCPHSTFEDRNGLAHEFFTSLSSSKGNEQRMHMEIRDSANPSCSQNPHQGCSTQMLTFEASASLQPNGEWGLAQVHEDHENAIFSVLSIDGAGEHTQMQLSMDSSSSLIENQPVHQEHDSQDAEGHVEYQINAESRDGDSVPARSLQQYHQEQQQQLLQGTGMCMPLQTEEELMIRDNQPCPTYPHNTFDDRNELALKVVTSPSSSEGNGQRRHMEIKDSAYPSCPKSPCHGSSTQMPSFETSVSLQPNREWGPAHMHEDCANASFSVFRDDGPGEHAQMYSASSLIENQPVHREGDGEVTEGHADHQGNAESGADDSACGENLQQMQGSGLQGEAFSRQELFIGEGKDEIQPGRWCSKDCSPPQGDYPEQGNQEGWCPYANNSHLRQHNDENVNLVSHGEESPAVKDAAALVESSQGVFGRISDETLLKVLEGDGVRENKQVQDGQRDKIERKATVVWNLELLEKNSDKSKRDHQEGFGSSFNGDSYNKEPSPATPHSRVFGVHEEDKGDASSQMTGSKMAISIAEVSVSGDRRQSRLDPQSEGEGETQANSADLVVKRRKSRWEVEEAKSSQIQLPDICKRLTGRVEVDPKGQTLNLQLLDMRRKLRSGQVLNSIPEGTRSSSAEPIYNNMGIRARETDNSNLYVGCLPTSVDDNGLMRLFLPFGTIQSVKLVKDRTTGISKRYGFVKFFEATEAAQAIAHLSGYRMEGKALAVRVAGKFSPVGVNPPPNPDPTNRFQPQQTAAAESEHERYISDMAK